MSNDNSSITDEECLCEGHETCPYCVKALGVGLGSSATAALVHELLNQANIPVLELHATYICQYLADCGVLPKEWSSVYGQVGAKIRERMLLETYGPPQA